MERGFFFGFFATHLEIRPQKYVATFIFNNVITIMPSIAMLYSSQLASVLTSWYHSLLNTCIPGISITDGGFKKEDICTYDKSSNLNQRWMSSRPPCPGGEGGREGVLTYILGEVVTPKLSNPDSFSNPKKQFLYPISDQAA